MQKVVGVKKQNDNLMYHFLDSANCKVGDNVVVCNDEFQTIAKVVRDDIKIKDEQAEGLGKILRIATSADISKYESLREKAKSQIPAIKKKSLELGLLMKFVDAEYSLDNSKIMITFSSEERVDFRQFLKDLAIMFKTRIELKQIGQRDEIKMCGGVGPCGEPCCCARFLNDFEHVTVKMAKTQNLSLAPTKINGICGRLMCCLGYETEFYEKTLAKMPKINSEVVGPKGKGTVVYNDILRERVSIKRQADGDTIVVEDFALDEIEGYGEKKENKPSFDKKPDKHQDKNFDKTEEKPVEKNVEQAIETITDVVQENKQQNEENKSQNKHWHKKFGGNKKHFGKNNKIAK